jgi:hypothetical protein
MTQASPTVRPALRASLRWTLVAGALAAVFLAYLQPDLAVELSNRLWSCF